ncbi:hypothetical protein ANANG_G00160120 [Anguilla anguilla]|uniref:K Homology domain-containing protein n=1 Tax=Anguilla anguilla TaxID=7936 RepID=A0A9D3RWJ6_ANGAN|nr:hypothetical protein ANANG_G00160120 [Anguilla anguilla]
MSLPVSSPNSKMNLTSPKRGQKREDGWKEVVRRSKKLSVPASVVSRIMGRGGCNITAIQDVTGAHIDVDKQKDKNGERMITIRGGTESTRHAVQLINALIQDPAKELEDLIPRNHIRVPGTNTKMGSTFTTATGSTSTAAAAPRGCRRWCRPRACPSSPPPPRARRARARAGRACRPGCGRRSCPSRWPTPTRSWPCWPRRLCTRSATRGCPWRSSAAPSPPRPTPGGPSPCGPSARGAPTAPRNTTGRSRRHGQVRPLPHRARGPRPRPLAQATTSPSGPAPPSLAGTPPLLRQEAAVLRGAQGGSGGNGGIQRRPARAAACGPPAPRPLVSAPPTTPPTPPPPPPIAPPTQQAPPPKPEPCAATTPSKEKSSSEQQATPVLGGATEGAGPLSFPAPPVALPQPELRQQQLPMSFAPNADPSPSAPPCSRPPAPARGRLRWLGLARGAPLCLISPPPLLPACSRPGHSTRWLQGAPCRTRSPSLRPPGAPEAAPAQQQQQQQQQGLATPGMAPPSLPMGMMNGSQMHLHGAGKGPLPPTSAPPPSSTISAACSTAARWATARCGARATCPPAPRPSRPTAPRPPTWAAWGRWRASCPPDSSKAPGYRCGSQRIVSSPIGMHPMDPSGNSISTSAALTSFATSISGSPVFLQGPAPVTTPSFSRQHFSPHPWSASTSCTAARNPPPSSWLRRGIQNQRSSGACSQERSESPVPSVSSGASSPLSASVAAPAMVQAKPSSANQQDRKVPQPIGTERLARIRQTGSVNPAAMLTTNYTPPVGQGGIWSFGVGSASEAMSGWSQPLMSSHMMQQQLPEQSAFSQHQPMERDDTGIVAPSNTFHQPLPSSYMDFPKGLPMSMYGGAMIPPHPPMAEGPAGPMYNGLHTADPAWNPILKVVPNNAENSDPQQQVWPGTWAPHVGNVHLNHVN